jgi:hypothetical protein
LNAKDYRKKRKQAREKQERRSEEREQINALTFSMEGIATKIIAAIEAIPNKIVAAADAVSARFEAQEQNEAPAKKQKNRREELGFWISVGTLVLVGVYTIITVFIWCTSKDTEHRQLRAYVFVSAAGGARDTETGKVTAVIDMKNFGQTPAAKLNGWIQIALGDNPQKGPLPAPEKDRQRVGESILGPTALQTPRLVLKDPVGPTDWSAVLVGSKAIFVWGSIFYEDAFGVQRCSNFRLLLSGDNARNGIFTTAENGNNEDCKQTKETGPSPRS